MKVSVLVPVYGVEKYIERCVISLFEQTYNDIEFIFVNDCTKDDSIAVLHNVLQRYPNRTQQVKIIKHVVNRGLAAARNTALDNATGDYLMHVDSDDYLETNAVELLVGIALEKNADIVVCDAKVVFKHKEAQVLSFPINDKETYLRGILNKSIAPSIWGKLYSMKFYKDSGVRSIEGLNHGEDYAVVPRLVYLASKVVKLDVALYNYVQYNEGAYTKNITEKSVDDVIWADKVLDDFFQDKLEYKSILDVSKLRSELSLLKMGQISIYDYIVQSYKTIIDSQSIKSLALRDRVLLYLVNAGYSRVAYVYSHCGMWIKNRMRRCK